MTTVAENIARIQQAKADIKAAIEAKGGTVGDGTIDTYALAVETIPSGGSGIDWSEIGYSSTPEALLRDFAYAKEIYDEWVPVTSLDGKFSGDQALVYMPLVDTSITTNMRYMFSTCRYLCALPLLNTSRVTNMEGMCSNMARLKDVPVFDTSSATNMSNIFSQTSALTDESLDNILQMCINATSYSGTKTFKTVIGPNMGTYYPTSKIQSLPHYQDFIDAGWTIGY